jgi:hypothetical protein
MGTQKSLKRGRRDGEHREAERGSEFDFFKISIDGKVNGSNCHFLVCEHIYFVKISLLIT